MSRLKLSSQINLIFSTVIVLACLIFILVLNLAFSTAYFNQNRVQLERFLDEVFNRYEVSPNDLFEKPIDSEFNDFIIFQDYGDDVHFSQNFLSIQLKNQLVEVFVENYLRQTPFDDEPEFEQIIPFTTYGGIVYTGRIIRSQTTGTTSVFVVSDFNAYMSAMSGNIPLITTIAFINILVLGYIVIWVWSSRTVKKLKNLQYSVEKMVNDNYQTPIVVEGGDEITDLADSIDNMRETIKHNEETKKEMLQNIGHDLKTPIAVIKSYAEAIIDGISDPKEASIIINQADLLSKRIKQLVELTKIEHLEISGPVEAISLKDVILQVVDNYKYLTNANFKVSLDDSTYPILEENLYLAISNVIENAIRYVDTTIEVTLKANKITIFNDGEKIQASFLPKLFQAYEKSSKGQFGLGLAITKTTLNRFGLQIKAVNKSNGVMFIIEPI